MCAPARSSWTGGLSPFLRPGLPVPQVTRTWRRGNNADFLGRVANLAVRRKWASLIAAFRTALRKVPLCTALTVVTAPLHMQCVAMLVCVLALSLQQFTTGVRCAPLDQDGRHAQGVLTSYCFIPTHVALAQVEASAGAEPPASASDTAAEGAERPPKRARLGAGTAGAANGAQQPAVEAAVPQPGAVGKPRAAEAPLPAVLREWRRFAEQLGAAERAAQAAEVCCHVANLSDPSRLHSGPQPAYVWLQACITLHSSLAECKICRLLNNCCCLDPHRVALHSPLLRAHLQPRCGMAPGSCWTRCTMYPWIVCTYPLQPA